MTPPTQWPSQKIGALLAEAGGNTSFVARTTTPSDDLVIEVRGVGRLRFPVSGAQAKKLCAIARPARYGQGEKTLLDRRVRDTFEVPKSRVKIDRRRFEATLGPVLEKLGRDLGLAEGQKLSAELHSLLVYGPGQFFLPHQDSEKADDMIGSLVVTLPSAFTGGALVVTHGGEAETFRASRAARAPLCFVAFYADCRHEVKPVKTGHRITLTYNLRLAKAKGAPVLDAQDVSPAVARSLEELVRAHFDTPVTPRYAWRDTAGKRPDRLVYLLDHEYTERGFGWDRLKGADAARAAALARAAEACGCEIVLALSKIHENWSAEEEWGGGWRGGYGHRWRDDDDFDDEATLAVDDPDRHTLVDLCDSNVELVRWVGPGGAKASRIHTDVSEEEIAFSTPTVDLKPYASEYEGFMGNYGNTVDRWYRRAALVLWPKARAFRVRAEASPAAAMTEIQRRLKKGALDEARTDVASLDGTWAAAVRQEERADLVDRTLEVATGLDDPDLARMLLSPFRLVSITPKQAAAFAAVAERYGEKWTGALVATWEDAIPAWQRHEDGRGAWAAALPKTCEKLRASDAPWVGPLLVAREWDRLSAELEGVLGGGAPTWRERRLVEAGRPLLGCLDAAAVCGDEDLLRGMLDWARAPLREGLLPCLLEVVKRGSKRKRHDPTALETIRAHCVALLEGRLARPERGADDWSIQAPKGCGCALCEELEAFLEDPGRRTFEWPLAKEKRRHVHGLLDLNELPVRHETRRQGSPYTLVLTKTAALFERERAERVRWQTDLDRLREGRALLESVASGVADAASGRLRSGKQARARLAKRRKARSARG